MSFIPRIKKLTSKLFTKHLLLTNASLGVFLFGLSDIVEQSLEMTFYEEKSYEARRTGSFMISGALYGMAGHYWYAFLERRIPGAAYKQVVKKLLPDLCIGPPVYSSIFIIKGLLEGESAKTGFGEYRKNCLLLLAADCIVYTPLQSINFFYVPPKYRVLYVCGLTFLYDMFLSYVLLKIENQENLKKVKD